jgi:hypothetical protein
MVVALMKFQSKPEGYLYALYVLESIGAAISEPKSESLVAAKADIRAAFESHHQDVGVVASIIKHLILTEPKLGEMHVKVLSALRDAILDSSYEQPLEAKLENMIGRHFESKMFVTLLSTPGPELMEAIKKMSDKIIQVLNHDSVSEFQSLFLELLTEESHALAFGSFKYKPSYQEVERILKDNNPEHFDKIMFIQFKFARDISRELHNIHFRFERASLRNIEITDERMYESDFYLERGREGPIEILFTQQMGIHQRDASYACQSLPSHSSTWLADARAQKADLSSPFTLDLICNDTPYVAGVSGMTSMLIGTYLAFIEDSNPKDQQVYIAGIAAFIVSGGYHCLHEVLAPIAYCLAKENLLPDYPVSQSEHGKRADAPDYHVFFNLIEKLMPQFASVRESVWKEMLIFMSEDYLPRHKYLMSYDDLCVSMRDIDESPSIDMTGSPTPSPQVLPARAPRTLVRAKPLHKAEHFFKPAKKQHGMKEGEDKINLAGELAPF